MAGIFNSAIFNNAIFNIGDTAPAPEPAADVIRNWRLRREERFPELKAPLDFGRRFPIAKRELEEATEAEQAAAAALERAQVSAREALDRKRALEASKRAEEARQAEEEMQRRRAIYRAALIEYDKAAEELRRYRMNVALLLLLSN